MYHRRRKGLSTLCLVLCAESIAFSDAVTFWNHYNAWSARNHQHHQQQQDTFEPSFSKASKQAQECASISTDDSSSSISCRGKRATPPPVRLFPRERLRFQSAIKTGDYCRVCKSRCQNEGAANNLIVRGGHGSSSTVLLEAAAGAAADVAGDALQVVKTTLPLGIPLNGWKVIFQFFLTLMNVVCWLIPLKSKKISENKVALSLANSFSGGVFLSLAFGHLLPECAHGFNGMNEATPFMLALVGYMLIFFVEKVAFDTDSILHHDGHSHGKVEQNGDSPPLLANGRGAVILLGALAVHSILEMMALGLADTFGDSALLSLSIALHQPAESIALLIAFIKSGLPESEIIKYLSIFSAMGPIGVALGMAVNEFAAPIVDAIMLAIVAGTFIYVGATEVIPEEFEDSENKWKKFIALVSGIVSIFVITQYTMTLEPSS